MNPWKTLDSKLLLENPWFRVRQDQVTTPMGKPGTYNVIEIQPFVIMAAIDADQIVMIEQYRYPLAKTMLELPAGSIDGDEDPLESAKREFQEETGLVARRWQKIGDIHEATSMCHAHGQVYLAQELSAGPGNKMQEDGIDKCIRLQLGKVQEMIRDGQITDTKTIAALYQMQLFRQSV